MIKSHFARLDGHMQEVVRSASLAFVLRVVGAGLAFAFNVAVARLLGAKGAGLYFLALSVTTIGSVTGRVGLDNTMLRFVAIHTTYQDWAGVKGVYALGMRIAVATSGAVTLIVFFAAAWIANVLFKKPELTGLLRWMSFSILPFALLNLHAESLKGLKRVRDAVVVQGLAVPLLGLLLIVPLVYSAGVLGVSFAYLASTTLVAALSRWAWYRAVAEHNVDTVPFPFRKLWASCRPLFMVSLMNRAVLPWAPFFLLGIWVSSEEVGVFGTALRVATLVSFMLATTNNVLAPKFAELYVRGDMEALGSTVRRSALLLTLLASPALLVLIFGGHWIMAMFGTGFEQGARPLAILAVGQFVNVLTGSVNHYLIVTGNETIVRNLTIATAVIQIGICAILIPVTGALGAAIAVALSTAGFNITSAYMVWKLHGVITIPFLGKTA